MVFAFEAFGGPGMHGLSGYLGPLQADWNTRGWSGYRNYENSKVQFIRMGQMPATDLNHSLSISDPDVRSPQVKVGKKLF